MLSKQVAAWARSTTSGEHDRIVANKIEQAVKAVLTRVYLVQIINSAVIASRENDERQLGLLEDLAGYVLEGGADGERRARWLGTVRRLLSDTLTWQTTAEEIGKPYFADESPLFGDVVAQLSRTAESCEVLLDGHNRAIVRGRARNLEAVDVEKLRAEAV